MKRNHLSMSLFLILGATVVGCAADAPGPDDYVDPTDPTDPNDPDQPVPLTPAGQFGVHSTFDISSNIPGTAGTVINYFIDATDEPDDPTKFIVEQIVEALPDGSIKNQLQGSIPFVAGYLNDRLLEVAPTFVTKVVDIGDAFGQVTRNFGTHEVYDISATGAATKVVQGVRFKIDNIDLDFAFQDYNIQNIQVDGLQVDLAQTGKITISQHKVPMKYGALLKLALEQAIIPMLDPSVSTLGDYLKTLVDCQAVGQYVFEAIDIGAPSTFEQGCNAGLTAAAATLYAQLDRIDTAALEFDITGTARGIDKDRDGKMDDVVTGIWTGDIAYAGTPAPLGTATFYGAKL